MKKVDSELDMYQAALQLEHPWYVERREFDTVSGRLDLYLNFNRKGTFTCATCDTKGHPFHDLVLNQRTWRHLDFWEHFSYLHMPLPRVKCSNCKQIKTACVPWARPKSGFTQKFEYYVLDLVKEMPVNAAARIVREYDKRLWRIVHHYVDKALAKQDLSKVKTAAIDETSAKRGHQYISLVMDLDDGKVIYVTEGKDASTLDRFKEHLEKKCGDTQKVEAFCSDLSAAFIQGVAEHFPNASHIFDKFHVMKLIHSAVDDVRRQEQKDHPELKKSRYVWLKNEHKLTSKQKDQLVRLKDLDLETGKAYRMKQLFQLFWTKPAILADLYLDEWYNWVVRSRIQPMMDVAKTIKRHEEGILLWFLFKISNGLLEGINSLVQAAKRKARGYRSTRNFIAMVYMIAGKLKLKA